MSSKKSKKYLGREELSYHVSVAAVRSICHESCLLCVQHQPVAGVLARSKDIVLNTMRTTGLLRVSLMIIDTSNP